MKKIYIAGKYSNLTRVRREDNTIAAMKAWWELIDHGFVPFCPHLTHFLTKDNSHFEMTRSLPAEFWYDYYLHWVKCCDAVLVISYSEGVRQEIECAKEIGIPVFYNIEEIKDGRF